jgi:hypothetical protein
MGYIAQGLTEADYRRKSIEIQRRQIELAERQALKSTFWKDLATVASAVIPLVTFFGLKEYFAFKRRRKK